ncbi:MAG: hypothetical protein ACI8W7_000251 [Gammaproteobacteria bacterium]|jgi:hypothetical protein
MSPQHVRNTPVNTNKPLQTIVTLAALFVALAPGQSAHSTVINNSVIIDLSLTSISNDSASGELILGNTTTLVSVTPFTAAIGDVLVTQIIFANGDSLKITDGPNIVNITSPSNFESLTFFFSPSGAQQTGSNSTTSSATNFLNLEGDLLGTLSNNSGVLGQGLGGQGSGRDLTDSFVSFTGVTITSTITITGIGAGGDPFDQPGLFGGRAGDYEIISGSTTQVPVPATLTLFALGLFGLRPGRSRRQLVGCAT